MLNRTNLTLSALSNRLNLGTRSLVLATSVNHGNQTLRIRHTLHDVMREEMVWPVVAYFSSTKRDIPPMPDSILPEPQQRPIRCIPQRSSRSARQQSAPPVVGQAWSLSQAKRGSLAVRLAAARKAPAARAAVAES